MAMNRNEPFFPSQNRPLFGVVCACTGTPEMKVPFNCIPECCAVNFDLFHRESLTLACATIVTIVVGQAQICQIVRGVVPRVVVEVGDLALFFQ